MLLIGSVSAWAQCPDSRPQAQFEQDLLTQREAMLAQVRTHGPDCARSVAEAYAYHAVTSQMRNCTTTTCSPWSKNLLTDEATRPQREHLTAAVRELVFMAALTEELPVELTAQICQELAPENPLALMRKKGVEELLAEMNCLELPVGQTRVVDGFNGNIAAGYTLERTGANSYRIGLNVNLTSPNLNAEVLASFEERMHACVANWNPVLRGPRGEQLTIALTNPTRTEAQAVGTARAPQHDIQVHSNWPRANSHNYPRNMSCATTMHELMHLMGLCDEYREQDEDLGFGCRVVPETVSLMADQNAVMSDLPQITQCLIKDEHRDVWAQLSPTERNALMLPDLTETLGSEGATYCTVVPEHRVLSIAEAGRDLTALSPRALTMTEDVLVLEAGVIVADTEARIEIRRMDCQCALADNPNKCRGWIVRQRTALAQPFVRKRCPSTMTGITTFGGTGSEGLSQNENGITITTAGTRLSALEPAHFQRILAGTCAHQARDYNICSSWAYVSECGAAQSSCFGTPDQCDGPPLQCTDERFLGISPSR
jgi:hypothetical protein